jgi:hypothetical protein
MKLNKLETHDRYLEFNKQADYISQGCRDCIFNRPKEFENYPFYIFAHKREFQIDERQTMYIDDLQKSLIDPSYKRKYNHISQVPTHKLIWQPRLTKPVPEVNSMLFKSYPQIDQIRIIWMIPAPELFNEYKKGDMIENEIVKNSIYDFENNKIKLAAKEADDLSDDTINSIYKEISKNANNKSMLKI